MNNHIKQLVYITLPTLLISKTSTKFPSQLFEETYFIFSIFTKDSKKKLFDLLSALGKILLIGIKKASITKIAKGILLFVSSLSSDTLIFISIRINKNKIDTAPTYTNKQAKPIKDKPMNIRFTDIFENKNIRYNTDTIGFLAITIKIADIIDIKLIKFKMSAKKPEDIVYNKR